ncbi:P-loop containing nucleoside triphosphate hydrolase protein [Lanmaoa asiatica]|nr:P-loop containing nucleoside triphosphate hydrolase protein [Lanmaoa asiatica]
MNPRRSGECWEKPTSVNQWRCKPSMKLDILATILVHHLAKDNAPPLKVHSNGISLEANSSQPLDNVTHPDPDQIVIFSAFPSSNAAIRDVLTLFNIKIVELNGKTLQNKRKGILNEFRSFTHDASTRVLILSMVGAIGLNLTCANIMAIADTLWSALDDEQLRGRLYRYPQQKQVRFYRLITCGTPDVFLNNITFDKGMLHLAFVGMDEKAHKYFGLFTGGDCDPINDHANDPSDDDRGDLDVEMVEEPTTRNKTGNKKSRVTSIQPPLSPTRPSSKHIAPTSLTSLKRAPPKGKKVKQTSTSAAPAKGKGKARAVKKNIRPITPTPFGLAPSTSSSATALALSISVAIPVPSVPYVSHDINTADATEQHQDDEDDPILCQIRNDPTWEKDPYQLDEMASLQLRATSDPVVVGPSGRSNTGVAPSSPLSSLLASPMQSIPTISSGIKPRTTITTFTPDASSSTPNHPLMEQLDSHPLIPAVQGHFKAPKPTSGKGKSKAKRNK